MAKRLSLFFLMTVSAAGAATDYFPPPDSKTGWRSLTTADEAKFKQAAGMDREKLDEAFRYAQETTQHGGLVVVRHGWLVFEKYFGRGNRDANPDSASCGKAFTSISCGIMLKEKRDKIPNGLEEKVFTEKYLPEAFPLDDPAKADIKLGQLLTMTGGLTGEGANPMGWVMGEKMKLEPVKVDLRSPTMDLEALHNPLWTKPGGGYSYASSSPHIVSILVRHLTGMELKDYIDEKLGKPMQWGRWDYCMYRNGSRLVHTPGAGSIALRSTDALRFAYMLLHNGRWGNRQLVPAEYVEMCGKPSPYDPHYPFSLQFEVNRDGHVAGAPRDAYWKSGAGGFGVYVVPSLDLAIYKMGGNDVAYDPAITGLPLLYKYDGSRDGWKPNPVGTDDGVRKVLAMVSAAVIK